MRTPTDANYDEHGFMIEEFTARCCKICGYLKDREEFHDWDRKLCKKCK
jgi:hypothetical protein